LMFVWDNLSSSLRRKLRGVVKVFAVHVPSFQVQQQALIQAAGFWANVRGPCYSSLE
jgi:hypothetical protein